VLSLTRVRLEEWRTRTINPFTLNKVLGIKQGKRRHEKRRKRAERNSDRPDGVGSSGENAEKYVGTGEGGQPSRDKQQRGGKKKERRKSPKGETNVKAFCKNKHKIHRRASGWEIAAPTSRVQENLRRVASKFIKV